MKKLFLLLIKYFPIIQLLSFLITNTLIYFDINITNCYYIDYIFGNSLINTITLYVASYALKFCKWHRILITTNLINLVIIFVDSSTGIAITDLQLLLVFYFIATISLIIIIKNKIKR